MPKQIHKITTFHGGINNNSDPRDILDEQFEKAENVSLNNLGKIVMGDAAGSALYNDDDLATLTDNTQAGAIASGTTITMDGNNPNILVGFGVQGGTIPANTFVTEVADSAANPQVFVISNAISSSLAGGTALTFYKGGPIDKNVAISHGNELIAFNSSYSGLHNAVNGDATALGIENTNYVAIGDNTDAGLYVFEHTPTGSATVNDWSNSNIIDLGGSDTINASFYYADGVLRVSDSSLNDDTSTHWIGPIDMEKWKRTTSQSASNAASYTYQKWFIDTAEPTAPVAGTSASTQSTSECQYGAGWDPDDPVNYPTDSNQSPANTGTPNVAHIIMRNTDTHGKGSGWTDGTTAYNFAVAVSFTYDGNQESALVPITNRAGDQFITPIAGNNAPNANVACRMRCMTYDGGALATGAADLWNPRITHINVYLKQEDVDTNFYLAAIFDTTLGGISVSEESSDATEGSSGPINTNTWWAQKTNLSSSATSADGAHRYSEVHMSFPPKFITHAEHSGIIGSHLSRNVLFKTAVIANRRAYLGNVRYTNDQGSSVVKEDAIIYSNVNQLDTFPLGESGGNFLETNINDGDSIVKLLEFNDRIIEFKQNKVSIINIANPLPFIEQSLQHNGIKQKAAAFRTDFGVVWANEQACWLYDGEKVTNLLQRDGVTLISQSNWSSFIQNPSAFYVPQTKQIGILGNTTSTNGHIYLYDLLTQGWTYHPDAQGSTLVSSIIINKDNKPMWYDDSTSSGTFRVWDAGTPAATAIKLHTKDIDFGQPSVRKKVYKVYVSYKGDGSSVSIKYGINGETDTASDLLPFYRTTADGSSDGTNSDTTPFLNDTSKEHWINAELKPVASINNIYSIQLFFDGTAGTDFEINDISIVYRMKSIK